MTYIRHNFLLIAYIHCACVLVRDTGKERAERGGSQVEEEEEELQEWMEESVQARSNMENIRDKAER